VPVWSPPEARKKGWEANMGSNDPPLMGIGFVAICGFAGADVDVGASPESPGFCPNRFRNENDIDA